jgi:hypothetical protein
MKRIGAKKSMSARDGRLFDATALIFRKHGPRTLMSWKDAVCYASGMDPLIATIEEFAADGFTHVECSQ